MKRNRHGNARATAAILVLATLVASCGDDSSSSGDTTIAAPTTVAVDTTVAAAPTAATTTAATTAAPVTTAAPATSTATTKGATATTKAPATVATSTATTAATTTTTGAPAKPTKSEIVLGAPMAFAGASASTIKFAQGPAEAWAAWVNAEMGGINGHPVRVIIKDTKGDPATASAVAKEMISNDHVVAVVGGGDPGTEAIWTKVFTDAKIPVIGGYTSANFWNETVGLFPLMTMPPAIRQVQVVAAKAVGAKKFGVLVCAEIPACAEAGPVYGSVTQALGIEYDGLLTVAGSDPNYIAACLKYQQDGVDFVQLSLSGAVGDRVRDDCAKQGYRPVFGATAGSVTGDTMVPASQQGAVFAGGLTGFPWWLDTPLVKQFRDVMAKYAPSKDYRSPAATTEWSSFEFFRKIMANASDNPTSSEIFNALYSVKNENLGGLLPTTVTFTAGQPTPSMKCFWNYKLQAGVFTASTPGCYP